MFDTSLKKKKKKKKTPFDVDAAMGEEGGSGKAAVEEGETAEPPSVDSESNKVVAEPEEATEKTEGLW